MKEKLTILFLSKITGDRAAGPTYSIPAQVAAQAKIDNVLWFNNNYNKPQAWIDNKLPVLNLTDIPSGRLNDLPAPFNHPDLIVVEMFYMHFANKIIAAAQKQHIPYIIVPRSNFTKQAQQHKPLKKWLGNVLYFKRMVRKAAAIQYLTQQEQVESGPGWNTNSFVIPNGISLPVLQNKVFSAKCLRAVYVGRVEKYQKGLDLLVEAMGKLQNQLRSAHFTLDIYGPDRHNSLESLKERIANLKLSDLISYKGAVFGAEKARVLQEADAFVMTSRFEGHPMGLIEALAYGLPCVVTTGTNMRPEIEQYNAGWTADNTVDSIAAALTKMLNERAQFAQKSVHARALAEQYDWDKIAQQSHQIYEEILNHLKENTGNNYDISLSHPATFNTR